MLTRTHCILIAVVVTGAVIIAGIGFAGSYAAVRELALKKGFGSFSYVFPIGIDAGICVLLALDLLLTWIRIPFPLLRQTAWLLTAATIAFNGAAAWPDPLSVGMHAVIPVLFIVAVEAARHAIGRIADITADKHMEGVRFTRWLLSPVPTFLLWRRMKLWELRSYDTVIKLEQERLVYRARLRSRFGRAWRRKAPVESLVPLRLARYGVPLEQTAPAGLHAAGIDAQFLLPGGAPDVRVELEAPPAPQPAPAHVVEEPVQEASPWFAPQHTDTEFHGGYDLTDADDLQDEERLQELDTVPEEPVQEWDLEEHAAWDNAELTEPEPEPVTVTDPRDRDETKTTVTDRAPSVPTADSGDRSSVTEPHGTDPLFTPAPVPAQALDSRDDVARLDAVNGTTAAQQPGDWSANVTDSGEATARVPQSQEQAQEGGDEHDKLLLRIIGLMEEFEAEGKTLRGAEVARQLKVSPSTGQRRLREAKAHREELQRAAGRSHLRSVKS
ncbi:DUF2637 domain-containing protein [Streptomyces sp. NPDC056656]|uniref:DUF2637 domain-containing protein n=1 Tax=Streptomyces sp. NPDC056656 TaxID=3345895 RepID=UPI00369D115F